MIHSQVNPALFNKSSNFSRTCLGPLTCVPFWGSPLGIGPSRGGSSGFMFWERGLEGTVRRAGTRQKRGLSPSWGLGQGEAMALEKSEAIGEGRMGMVWKMGRRYVDLEVSGF